METNTQQTNNEPTEEKGSVEQFADHISNAGAAMVSGTAKLGTNLLSLGIDAGASALNKISEGTVSNKTIKELHETIDFTDGIAEGMLADKESTVFKTTELLTEIVGTTAQVASGVGAFGAAAKGGKLLAGVKSLVIPSKLAAKAGGAAVNAGSKLATTAKVAGVGFAEEALVSGSSEEGSDVFSSLKDLAGTFTEKDNQKLTAIEREFNGAISKIDADLAEELGFYSAQNPKNEDLAAERLKNRLMAGLGGAAVGAGADLLVNGFMTLAKQIKGAKVARNMVKDAEELEVAVLKEVEAKKITDPEELEKVVKTKKQELKEARERVIGADGKPRAYNPDKYIKDSKKYDEFVTEINNSQSSKLTKIQADIEAGALPTRKQKRELLDEAKRLYGFEPSDAAKFSAKGKAGDEMLDELVMDTDFFADLAAKQQAKTSRLDEITEQIMFDKGEFLPKIDANTMEPEDWEQLSRLDEMHTRVETARTASSSFSGQQLAQSRYAKKLKQSTVNRLIETKKKSLEYRKGRSSINEYERRVLQDKNFRNQEYNRLSETAKKELGARAANWNDKLYQMYKRNLLLGTAGLMRNATEGFVLTGYNITKETGTEIFSQFSKTGKLKIGTSAKHFAKSWATQQVPAFRAMVDAFKNGDPSTVAKLGMSDMVVDTANQGRFMALLDKVTSAGQRSIAAGDGYISHLNEVAFVGKEAAYLSADIMKHEDLLRRSFEGVTENASQVAETRALLSSHGINPEYLKGMDSKQMLDTIHEGLLDSPIIAKRSEDFKQAISMNSNPEDLGITARAFNSGLKAISEAEHIGAIGKWFVPFRKPAVTALDTAIELTPMLNSSKLIKKIFSGDPKMAAEGMSQLSITYSGAGFMWAMLESGMATGAGPTDPNDAKLARAAGFTPYTIDIGGTKFNMRGSIVGEVFSVVSEIRDLYRELADGSDEEKSALDTLASGVLAIGAEVGTGFWSDTLGNVVKAFEGDVRGEAARAQLVKMGFKTIPLVGATVVNDIRNAADDNLRDRDVDKDVKGGFARTMRRAMNEIMNGLPVLSERLPTKVSYITGEPIKHGKVPFTPVSFFGTDGKGAEVGNYLQGLITQSGGATSKTRANDLRFTQPTKNIRAGAELKGQNYNLSAEEYNQINGFIANPEGAPSLVDALSRIAEQHPLKEIPLQADKDLVIDRIKDTISTYKKMGRDQFRRTSDDYRDFLIIGREKERSRRNQSITLDTQGL